MKFSVALPQDLISDWIDGRSSLAILAQAAEAAGFHACSVTDHPVPTGRWLDGGGHLSPDPFTALGFIAASTRTIKVQTAILVLPYRNPFLVARAANSVDLFSGGRLILGVGVGYLKGEYRALGVDHEARNDLTDEYLAALKAAWINDEFEFTGTGYQAVGNRILPHVVQKPHPPIWVGGNARRAIRRAVQYGDAWLPFNVPADSPVVKTARTVSMGDEAELAAGIAYLREQVEAQQRTRPIAIVLDGFRNPQGGPQAILDAASRLEQMGISSVGVHIEGKTVAEWCDNAARYGAEVVAKADA
jgi:probable F420-dependent oxidoreductase